MDNRERERGVVFRGSFGKLGFFRSLAFLTEIRFRVVKSFTKSGIFGIVVVCYIVGVVWGVVLI